MTQRTRGLFAVAIALLLGLVLWGLLTERPPTLAGPSAGDPAGGIAPASAEPSIPSGEAGTVEAPERELVSPVRADAGRSTGSILVEASYGDDRAPVPDLVIVLAQPGADRRFAARRVRTDARGAVRFAGLPSGSWWVGNTRNDDAVDPVEVRAGEETRVALVLSVGVRVTGVVVDALDRPVAGAQVWLATMGAPDRNVEHVADTGADGRFALRSCPTLAVVGARAHGHAPSRTHLVQRPAGESVDLRLQLPGPGGTVEGIVRGPDRVGIDGAVVRLGDRRVTVGGPAGAPAPAAWVRTDADGRFRAVGLQPGEHPVHVRALGWAPWTGSCLVAEYAVAQLEIVLGAGMACTGVVLGVDKTPVSRARVEVGASGDLAHHRTTRSAADGTFRLDDLAPGAVVVRCKHRSGEAEAVVRGGAGDTVSCELRLRRGTVLKGRVVTADGKAAPGTVTVQVRVEHTDDGRGWVRGATAAADGRFAVTNCPPGKRVEVMVWGASIRAKTFAAIDPAAGEHEFRVIANAQVTARIVGHVVDHRGQPVDGGRVRARSPNASSNGVEAKLEKGRFDLGPLPAGTWRVSVLPDEHPYLLSDPWELAAGAVLNIGTLELQPSGRIRVRLRGAEGHKLHLSVSYEDGSPGSGIRGGGAERLSRPLAPGEYRVSVLGTGVASQVLPATVRAGEESVLDVTVEAGHPQLLQWVSPEPLRELLVQGPKRAYGRFGRAAGARRLPERAPRRALDLVLSFGREALFLGLLLESQSDEPALERQASRVLRVVRPSSLERGQRRFVQASFSERPGLEDRPRRPATGRGDFVESLQRGLRKVRGEESLGAGHQLVAPQNLRPLQSVGTAEQVDDRALACLQREVGQELAGDLALLGLEPQLVGDLPSARLQVASSVAVEVDRPRPFDEAEGVQGLRVARELDAAHERVGEDRRRSLAGDEGGDRPQPFAERATGRVALGERQKPVVVEQAAGLGEVRHGEIVLLGAGGVEAEEDPPLVSTPRIGGANAFDRCLSGAEVAAPHRARRAAVRGGVDLGLVRGEERVDAVV